MGETSPCLLRSLSQPSDSFTEPREVDPLRALRSSISFGRYVSDSSSWEKWSCFTNNRYLEEEEKIFKPGSVAEKKALLEAHFKKLGAKKANIGTNDHEISNVDKSCADSLILVESPETTRQEIDDKMQEKRGSDVLDHDVERQDLGTDNIDDVEAETKTKAINFAEKVIRCEVPKPPKNEVEHAKNVSAKQEKTPIIASVRKNILRLIRPKSGSVAENKAQLEAHLKKIGVTKTNIGANNHEPSNLDISNTDPLIVLKSSEIVTKEIGDAMQEKGSPTVLDSDFERKGLDRYKIDDVEMETNTIGIEEKVIKCQVYKPQENEGEHTNNVSNEQEKMPIIVRNHANHGNLVSTSKNKPAVGSSKKFTDIREAKLEKKTQHNKEDNTTQNSKKIERGSLEKKTSTKNSLYMSVDCSSRFGENSKRSTSIIQKKGDPIGTGNSSKLPRDASIPHQTLTAASVAGTLVQPSLTIQLEKRIRTQDKPRVSRSTAEPHSPAIDSKTRGHNMQTRTVASSPFGLRCEGRVAQRKEYFQKLEEKQKAKEAEKVHLQAKSKKKSDDDLKAIRKLSANSWLDTGLQNNNNKKVPLTWPQSPKLGKQQTSRSLWRPTKIIDSTSVKEKSIQIPICPSSNMSRNNKKENGSPNIQRWL